MGIKKNIQYRYTPTGQKSLMIDPDGGRHTHLYDAVKQLTAVINPQGERTSYGYDAGGRRTAKKLANGSRTSFSYDGANRITTVAHLKSDNSVQAKYDYKYDKAGNRTAMSENGATTARTTFAYDAAYQLTGEHRTGANAFRNTYTYDNRGNRLLKNLDGTRTTSSYDDANQLSWTQDPGGRTTYVYDGNGNQEVTITPSGSRTTNVWDYENRLVGVRHPSGSRETMAYDPDGKRIQHETGAATTKFVWDGQAYLLETDASGITVVTFTNEPTTYGRLISQRKAGATHYYVFDALGSTRLLMDASQNVAESLLYDAWGNLVGSAPSMTVPFRWVGELGYLFVPSTGDYYVRERILRPTVGRWISQDPLGFVEGVNRFVVVGNSAAVHYDPSGLRMIKCIWRFPSQDYIHPGPRYERFVDCVTPDPYLTVEQCCRSVIPRRALEAIRSAVFVGSEDAPAGAMADPTTPEWWKPFPCTVSNFLQWHKMEMRDLSWVKDLPDCPCNICFALVRLPPDHFPREVPVNPDSAVWHNPDALAQLFGYHPQARACMRSRKMLGTDVGQQCCYDDEGRLITVGENAGTADFVTPSESRSRHLTEDVDPYNCADQLEYGTRGGLGGFLQKYHDVRPTNKGVGCEERTA